MKELNNWAKPKNGTISVPDALDPLVNTIAFQLKLHTISQRFGESEMVCRMAFSAQKFFRENPELLNVDSNETPVQVNNVVIKTRAMGPTSPNSVQLGMYRCEACGEEYEVMSHDAQCPCKKTTTAKVEINPLAHEQTK